MQLEGKVAIVTGAASGQGKESALLFAREGAKVVCADWNEQGAEEVAEQIRGAGGEAIGVHVDVSKGQLVKVMVDRAVHEYGSLDVLFNNAGIGFSESPR